MKTEDVVELAHTSTEAPKLCRAIKREKAEEVEEVEVVEAVYTSRTIPETAASLSPEELANIGRALKYIEGKTNAESKSGKSKAPATKIKTQAGKSKVKQAAAKGASTASKVTPKGAGDPSKTIAKKLPAKKAAAKNPSAKNPAAKKPAAKKPAAKKPAAKKPAAKKPAVKSASTASKVKLEGVGGPSKTIAKKSAPKQPTPKKPAPKKAAAAKGMSILSLQENTLVRESSKRHSAIPALTKGKASGESSSGVSKLKKTDLVKVKLKDSVDCKPFIQVENKTSTATGSPSPPRVCLKMYMSDMKAEALLRGHSTKELPKKKADLLYLLGDGSICLRDSAEYKAFEALKAKTIAEKESPAFRKQNEDVREKAREKDRRREAVASARELEIERERQSARANMRRKEISDQAHLHSSFRCPSVHQCLLADATFLRLYGSQRSMNASCSLCFFGTLQRGGYSCEKCDFDICSDCYRHHNMSPAEKRAHTLKAEAEEAKVRAEAESAYDMKQFRAAVITPSDSAKQQGRGLGFTVWCGNGYFNDSFHRNNGPIEKEFDTEWATKEEANERARYLFYWRSPWGLGASELEGPEEEENMSGCMKFEWEAGDSELWTVGVVPSPSFLLLDHATTRRHNHDRLHQESIGFF